MTETLNAGIRAAAAARAIVTVEKARRIATHGLKGGRTTGIQRPWLRRKKTEAKVATGDGKEGTGAYNAEIMATRNGVMHWNSRMTMNVEGRGGEPAAAAREAAVAAAAAAGEAVEV
jgi:hypothetical protein